MKRLKKLPKFKNEAEEAKFWNTHDSTEYLDWSKARHVIFPNLKPTSRSISLRLPEYIINQVKIEANKLDIPYQTLMKQYIAKGVRKN
jgi:predicted DNA binding CopG/RHH family protein